MKRYSIHSLLAACLMTIVTGLALVSCSQDEVPDTPALVPEGSPVTVSLTLSTRAEETTGNDPYYGYPDGKIPAELINSWWVVALTANGDQPGDFVAQKYGPLSEAAHETSVSLDLPAPADGQYYFIFAFANIDPTDVKAAFPDQWGAFSVKMRDADKSDQRGAFSMKMRDADESETRAEDYDAIAKSIDWSAYSSSVMSGISDRIKDLNDGEAGSYVPMSGINKVKVTRHVNQKYSIEVVRMLAKIRFEFSNDTQTLITVNSITMKPDVSGGKLNLFPQYDSEWNFLTKEVALDSSCGNGSTTWTTNGIDVPVGTLTATGATSFTRYLREMVSKSNEPSGLFELTFNIKRGNRDEEQLFTYTADDFNYINRNDYIILPIRFSDWVIEFDLQFFPPIGGYPAIIEENTDEYKMTLGSQGRFYLTPKISRYQADGTLAPLDKDKYTFSLSTQDANGILAANLDTNSLGEIYGDLKAGAKGTAKVLFTLESADGVTANLPTKKIYITRR